MRTIKYILVNETGSENAGRTISDCKFDDIRQHLIVNWGERSALIRELVGLRRHWPDAKILGISELGEHCVHPSERMNKLRRELSDLP